MAVIKNAQSSHMIKDAIVLDLADLNRQAEKIIHNAEVKADALLKQAKAEAQTIVDGAHDEGYDDGLQRGLAEGREAGEEEGLKAALAAIEPQLQQLQQALLNSIEQWEHERNDMLLAAREDVLALALEIAEKVVFRIVEADATVIEDQLTEALTMLSRPTAAIVRIHPDDRELVEAMLPDIKARLNECEHFGITDDPAMTRGGCIVSTTGGHIDATIEKQIDRIVGTLLPTMLEDQQAVEESESSQQQEAPNQP